MSKKLIKPGFFSCRIIIGRLKRFKNLVLHYCPFAGYDRRTEISLEELLPRKIEKTYEKYDAIKEELDKLVPLVRRDLARANIACRYVIEKGFAEDEKEEMGDAILDFLRFFESSHSTARPYDLVISILNRGIGYYEHAKKQGFKDFINPLAWIAFILKIPLIIIQKAGLASTDESATQLLKFYGLVVRILVVLILTFLATKLGISVQWSQIINLFK